VTPDRYEIRDRKFWRIRPGQDPEQVTASGWIGTALDKADRARRKNEGER